MPLSTEERLRLEALERRVEALEAVRPFRYRGKWVEGKRYKPNDWVSFRGCTWHCSAETTLGPRDDHIAWRLAVKAGRDLRPKDPAEQVVEAVLAGLGGEKADV